MDDLLPAESPVVSFAHPWLLLPGALALLALAWAAYRGRGPGSQLSPSRRRMALLLRSLAVAVLVAALAGVRQALPSDRLTVVFLLDRSLSARHQEAFERDFVTRALPHQREADQVAVVTFGGDAAVELPPARPSQIPPFTARLERGQSDLAGAIRFACAGLPSGSAARLVVLSDGVETRGQAAEEAEIAHKMGVEVWTVPLPEDPHQEVLLESITMPPRLRRGTPFEVSVTVVSSQAEEHATLTLRRNGKEIARQGVRLERGRNVFLIPQQIEASDPQPVQRYTAQVESAADNEPANNQASETGLVEGPARVLYLTGGKRSPGPLAEQLRQRGVEVEERTAFTMPGDLAAWQGFQSVVLDDVGALDMSPIQLDWLTSMIRETGLGLVVLGGPNSYGAGGYFKSALEEALPVSLEVKRRKNTPVCGIIHLIDKSGSMAEKEGDVEKMALAREASIAAIEMMSNQDNVGVIGFDSAYKWVVPFARVENPKALAARVATLQAGGGTSLFAGLRTAVRTLVDSGSPVKHVIVLTDGVVEPADFDGLTAEAAKGRVTISTVAVGGDADLRFLQHLAQQGHGEAYLARQGTLLPRIFTRDTVLAARSAFVEEPCTVTAADAHPILRGVEAASAPPLRGYNLVSAKGSPAQVLLLSSQEDPVLAAGRHGLGKVVAFMGDNGTTWCKPWQGWTPFAELLVQAVRWTTPETDVGGLGVQLERRADDRWHLVAHVPGPEAAGLEVGLVSPNGQSRRLGLTQTGPDRFEAELDADAPGSWLYHVATADGAGVTRSFSLPYSRELASMGNRPDVLAAIAEAGGGKFAGRPEEVFAPVRSAPRYFLEIWPNLIVLALLLLPLEVAVRRLALPGGWRRVSAPAGSEPETAENLLTRKRSRPKAPETQSRPPIVVEDRPRAQATAAPEEGQDAMERLKRAATKHRKK